MRDYGAATNAHLAAAGPRLAHLLVWIEARERTTGETQALGVWTGAQAESFTIGGVARSYAGAGGIVGVPQLTRAIGLDVRLMTLRLIRATPAIRTAIAAYDARHAPVEIHRALYDPETGGLIAEPHLVFRGFVDQIDSTTAPLGGESELPAKLAPFSQSLTRTLPTRYAHETGKAVGDGIFRYASVSGEPNWYWGTKAP